MLNFVRKKENWTAVVQHWLLGNQTGSLFPWLQGRFQCSPCPPAGWQVELCGEKFGRFLFTLLSGEMVLTLHVRHGERVGLEVCSETVQCRGFTASALAASAEGVRAKPTLKWKI